MHHEMAAAIAAEGYSRASENIGVAMATSGPGATNLITGIGSCYFDSIPCLFITGQVNTYEYKFSKPVRQIGFQETDIVNIVKPIVKYAVLVKDLRIHRNYWKNQLLLQKKDAPARFSSIFRSISRDQLSNHQRTLSINSLLIPKFLMKTYRIK